jgi:iron only hydrogenase large subunit-like protein
VKRICVSISPQSRASLAIKYGMSLEALTRKLCGYFKHKLCAEFVFDTTFSREFSLLESQREFVERYRQNERSGGNSTSARLPILSSACPGWICYAEKTHGSFILPYISTVKSPQQVMGTLIKEYICKKLDTTPDKIYHLTVMPCYDKKLEASRKDFYNELYDTRDVDCVLSTSKSCFSYVMCIMLCLID